MDPNLFKSEIEKSLLLEDEDKQYWTANADKLPQNLLEYFYGFLKEKNDLVDSYLLKALQSDPEIINQLKQEVNRFRTAAGEMMQSESGDEAEKNLEEELGKI